MILSLTNIILRIPRKLRQIFYIYYYRIFLRVQGCKIGENCRIFTKFYFQALGKIKCRIGSNFVLTSGDNYNPLSRNVRGSIFIQNNGILEIGNGVGMSSPVIWVAKSIKIGNNCIFGFNSILMDTDAHSMNYLERRNNGRGEISSSPIVIGDDVWVGANVTVLKGVHIGDRAIIGAGSVVTKDIPADCIAAGNPCQIIRFKE